MARQWRRQDRVFTAGIVWDPREPLPGELQPGYGDGTFGRHLSKLSGGLAQVPRFEHSDGHVGQPSGTGGIQLSQHIQAATLWPNLPSSTVQEQVPNILPPLSVEVDASVLQDTAQVAVTQLFWNDSTVAIKQAAFTFPLPAGCTVTDFTCQFGTKKIIRGTVKPREEARDNFQRHIRGHDTGAGLLEQDTPEIFTTTLGNIPAKTKVKVNLTYISVLKHRFADSRTVTTLTIPTYIAHRYGNAPEDYNGAESTSVPQGLTLGVEIVESDRITSINSPSHVIEVKRRHGARNAESFADLAGEGGRSSVETAAVALPSGSMLLDRDFVLDIETKPHGNSESPQAWLEEHLILPNHRALMLTIPPQFLTHVAPPMQRSEILFLADRSGSMEDKILSLKSAMRFFLKGIPEGRKFNIWCFGTHYNSWQPLSVDYDESTLNSALAWVENTFAADMGGTELLPAIQAIVQARDKSLMTDVIVLTDGETWRLDQTLDYIEKTRGLTDGRVRFFALGMGNAVSHALVDGIAKAGGGYVEVVPEASRGGWEDRVVSMAKAALLSAHLGPLHLSFQIQDQNGRTRSSTLADARRSPADTSALSPFDRNRIYFLSDVIAESESITSVTVEMSANQETKTVVIPVTVLEKRDAMLHKLAARSMLDDLERGRSHIHIGPDRPYQGSWEEKTLVRKEAEEIACKWSLVSKWTSFFFTEELLTLTEKDPFMEGVVEVTEAPGEDLLRPRSETQLMGNHETVGPCYLRQYHSPLTSPGLSYTLHSAAVPAMALDTSGFAFHRSVFKDATRQGGKLVDMDTSKRKSEEESEQARKRFDNRRPHISPKLDAYPERVHDTEFWSVMYQAGSALPGTGDTMSDPLQQHEMRGVLEVHGFEAADSVQVDIFQGFFFGADSVQVQQSQDARGNTVLFGADLVQRQQSQLQDTRRNTEIESQSLPAALRSRSATFMDDEVVEGVRDDTFSNEDLLFKKQRRRGRKGNLSQESKQRAAQLRLVGACEECRTRKIRCTHIDPLSYNNPLPYESPYQAPEQQRNCLVDADPHGTHHDPWSWHRFGDGDDVRRQAVDTGQIHSISSPPSAPVPDECAVVPVNESSPDTEAEAAFISLLLAYQKFDGSIFFGDIMQANKHLGRDIVDALRGLRLFGRTSAKRLHWRVLWTAAVLVLLERDMQSCKSLWELMAMKMASYCEKHSPSDSAGSHGSGKTLGWLDEVRTQLEGLRLPVHRRKGVKQTAVGGAPAPATQPNEGDNTRDNTLPQPQPEVESSSDPDNSTGGSRQLGVLV
ncbi:hypothetical protein N658DRAFT_333945 [Parathielavia hyrcaniae]|uniref:Uncharacterized protein n=1 Tax=Parathielavia hyrcaniae TaxID=113614 RepID=A0AAN6SXK4_9PEZI|nr:hypothetical protein N658DRAFT_333945 [Parathielavia hyrcaniae]